MNDPNKPAAPGRDALAAHLLEGLGGYGVFALDAGGRVACWSASGEALTGYREGEIVGEPLARLCADEALGAGAAAMVRAEEGGSAELEAPLVRRDGTPFWGEILLSAMRAEGSGSLAGYAVVLRDVTERRRQEEALRLRQATFEGILAIASDAVVCIDEGQRITFFNQGAEGTFGWSASEVLGRPLEILIPEHARPAHARHVRTFAASGVAARRMGERGAISGRRKSGELFPAEASISQLEVGGTRVFTAVVRDVTERRRAEEVVEAHARELARSNAELEQFAYVASHDLQEPLRMVASYTQLLARRYRGRLDEDADEFIGYAVDGVTRMQALINDLLAYSRVGSRPGEPTAVDMERLMEQVLRDMAPALEEAKATVSHDALPTVWGDPGQLNQLLQNLLANAVKFRGEAPPHVHVSARREEGAWHFSVRDNGIGIPAEFAERIFVIFQRLHSRGEYPGTGIGLAICRKIVERHGGSIGVEPAPGGGSIFHFTLPDREGGGA